jgi:hypothetical protein
MNIFALIVLIVLNNVTALPSHEFDENMLDLFSEAVLGDGQNRRQLQTEMSSECLDKLCYMMQSFATCEVLMHVACFDVNNMQLGVSHSME